MPNADISIAAPAGANLGLRVAGGLQALAVGLWLLSVLTIPAHFAHLGWFLFLLPIAGVCMMVALWHLWRVQTNRSLAWLVLLTTPLALVAGFLLAPVAKVLWLSLIHI